MKFIHSFLYLALALLHWKEAASAVTYLVLAITWICEAQHETKHLTNVPPTERGWFIRMGWNFVDWCRVIMGKSG